MLSLIENSSHESYSLPMVVLPINVVACLMSTSYLMPVKVTFNVIQKTLS